MSAKGFRIGIDLGGTKIEAVALDPQGHVVARHRIPTPHAAYADTLDSVAGLVDTIEAEIDTQDATVGVGTPGSISPVAGSVRNAHATRWNGERLDQDLSDRLGRPVRIANDANCFALAEAIEGAGKGFRTVFGVILGTGVGGGIVIDGQILVGRNRLGGEWGHNALPWPRPDEIPGPASLYGKHGCIEAWCSGPGLAADHQRETGFEASPADIAMLASAGDMAAQDTLDRHLGRLARALAGIVNILDPDVIVLGGGLSNMDHLVTGLGAAMKPYVFSDTFETPIVRNALGDSAGVIGAAWLWPLEE